MIAIPALTDTERDSTGVDDAWEDGVSATLRRSNSAAEQVYSLQGLDYSTQSGNHILDELDSHGFVATNDDEDLEEMSFTYSGSSSSSTSSLHSYEVSTLLDINIPVLEGDVPERQQHLNEVGSASNVRLLYSRQIFL